MLSVCSFGLCTFWNFLLFDACSSVKFSEAMFVLVNNDRAGSVTSESYGVKNVCNQGQSSKTKFETSEKKANEL